MRQHIEYERSVNSSYFYDLLWKVDPALMFDVEALYETSNWQLESVEEDLFCEATKLLNNPVDPRRVFWLACSIPHITSTKL